MFQDLYFEGDIRLTCRVALLPAEREPRGRSRGGALTVTTKLHPEYERECAERSHQGVHDGRMSRDVKCLAGSAAADQVPYDSQGS